MRIRPLFSALVLTLSLATPLIAHDTWLAPDRFRMSRPNGVTLSLSSGMEFPKLDHAIAADRIAKATWRSARHRGDLRPGTSAAHALELQGDAAAGVTVFSVVLHPRPSTLKREQVREYVHHLGIPNAEAVFEQWKRTAKAEETGYRYMKYAKTFVRTGAAAAPRIWAEPVGMHLELVPQNDPTSLVAGGTLDVLLLDRGRPLPQYPVALLREGTKEATTGVTDGEGRVRLTLSHSGRFMLRAATLEPSADLASTWDVHFTTMTFAAGRR